MKLQDFNLDDFEDDPDLDMSPVDMSQIDKKIPSFTSEKLCEMIVCDRYFGCYKDLAVLCMQELANRRIAGDNFAFESYIEESLKKLPVLDFAIPDLSNVLRQAVGSMSK